MFCCSSSGALAETSVRVPVDVNAAPWAAIGKIFNSIGNACTGSLIGPSKVLTAAHCLFSFRARRFLPAESIHYLLGYQRGKYRLHLRVNSYRIAPGYDPAREKETVASDWAVLTLTQAVPDVSVLRLDPLMPKQDAPVSLAGYEQARAYVLTADLGCRVLQNEGSKLFSSDCKAFPGDSGGPILSKDSGSDYRLVGMQVVTAKLKTDPDRTVAIAISSSAVASGLRE